MCKKLSMLMLKNFVPEKHWTSHRRTKARLPPLTTTIDDTFAFTFADTDAIWTKIVARSGIPDAMAWCRRPPTWHIIVKTTEGPLADRFILSASQLDKVRSKTSTPLTFEQLNTTGCTLRFSGID